MADLCSRSEQCEADIRRKLQLMGIPGSAATEIIDDLTAQRFIDNSRYARAFANDKARFSGWGQHKIKAALAVKRISSSDISEAIENVESEIFQEAADRACAAKARTLDLTEYTDRTKLTRHLLSKGFTSSEISRAISKLRK